MSVDIVLATFNGGRFIRQLLDSLVEQSFSDFQVLIGDDGSMDNTLAIVDTFVEHFPDRFLVLDQTNRLGVAANFSRLLQVSKADYIFFADQDDVWDVDKVAVSIALMQSIEDRCGSGMPLLVHSDLRVVDSELRLISSSFFSFQKIDRSRSDFCSLLFQNMVTGCSMLVNRSLADRVLPFPKGIIMHDWWIAIVASAFGQIHAINRPLISYRQHCDNEVGAKGWSLPFLTGRFLQLFDRRQAARFSGSVICQASVFRKRFWAELSVVDRELADHVCRLGECRGVLRVFRAITIRARKHGSLRTIALYWSLFWADFSHGDYFGTDWGLSSRDQSGKKE